MTALLPIFDFSFLRPSSLRALCAGLVLLFSAGLPVTATHAEELPVLPLTVNVNTADARTIANVLQGVGLSRATAIVNYRQEHGSFVSVESLREVKGVGQRTIELNATRILLSD